MISLHNASLRSSIYGCQRELGPILRRNASLTSAISRGVRKAANALKNAENKRIQQGTTFAWEKDKSQVQAQEHFRRRRLEEDEQKSRLEWLSTEEEPQSSAIELQEKARKRDMSRRAGILFDTPSAIPYTHAASEFLCGTFPIICALKARRRELYKLYVWCGEDGDLLEEGDEATTTISRLAHLNKIKVLRVAGSWGPMLDRMRATSSHGRMVYRTSKVRFVLEAGPIPQVTVRSLDRPPTPDAHLRVCIQSQGRDKAYKSIKRIAKGKRYPFLLWLDRIIDTGNMGAIIRSAYYFGADAIVVPGHGTASLAGSTISASAGAVEFLPVLSTEDELNFVRDSQQNGWVFYATAVSGGSGPAFGLNHQHLETALSEHPCVLIMGNEAEGLRPFLAKEADHTVSIEGARDPSNDHVDSLNVSVAAALLVQRFLGRHIVTHER